MEAKKKKILITLSKSKKGGPHMSHMRIMQSCLQNEYCFIPYYVPRTRIMLKRRTINELKRVINIEQPDIIHIAGLQLSAYITLKVVKHITHGKIPVLLAIHGSSSEALNIGKIKKAIAFHLEKYTLKNCDASYGVSKYTGNIDVVKRFAHNYKGYIYNLPEKNAVEKSFSRTEARKNWNISENSIVVSCTGRVTEDKGFDILLDVILGKDYPDNTCFIISGDGDYLNTMKDRLNQALIDNVIFTGYIDNVGSVLAASDIFIMCSKHETLCMSVLEAGSYKLPVIASAVGGMTEIIDSDDGIPIFNLSPSIFSKAISRLALSKDERECFGNKLEERVNMICDEETNMRKLGDVYESLC